MFHVKQPAGRWRLLWAPEGGFIDKQPADGRRRTVAIPPAGSRAPVTTVAACGRGTPGRRGHPPGPRKATPQQTAVRGLISGRKMRSFLVVDTNSLAPTVRTMDTIHTMDQTREKLQCAVCGWQWFKRLGQQDPARCANPDCRSKRWKRGENAGDHPDDINAVPEGCSTAEGHGDGSVLEAMRPAAERVVKRIADELRAQAVAGPSCSKCGEPLDSNGFPQWCSACRDKYRSAYDALRAESQVEDPEEKRRYVPLED